MGQLPRALARIDVNISDTAAADLEALAFACTHPAPFDALGHGDPCPDNNVISNGQIRLIDFEVASMRPALLDGIYANVPFPTCWCVSRLPDDLVTEMELAYRAELEQRIPSAADGALFFKAEVEASAFWVLNDLAEWLLPRVLEEDRPWGLITNRQRLLMRLPLFATMAEKHSLLPGMSHLARTVHARLKEFWPEVPEVPLFPAFRTG